MMSKAKFEEFFKFNVMGGILREFGKYDRPARRQAWNDTIDALVKDGCLSPRARDWAHPQYVK